MKRKQILMLLLALALCLSFCACGSEKEAEPSETQPASDVTAETSTEATTDAAESAPEEETIYNLGDTIETSFSGSRLPSPALPKSWQTGPMKTI